MPHWENAANATFLHRFEERGLRLRRSAVDFIGQNEIREERSRLENATALSISGIRPITIDEYGNSP